MEVTFQLKTGGIRGIVIKPEIKDIEFDKNNMVKVGAGVLLSKISMEAYNKGLSGLEFAIRNSWHYRGSNKNECRGIWR